MIQSGLGAATRSALASVALTMVGASAHDGCAGADAIALARAPPQDKPPDLTVEEWDELFAAVGTRLERTVATLLISADGNDAMAQPLAVLLECVEALGQLRTLRAPERDHCRRLELEVFDLRTALALALTELVEMPARARLAASTTELTTGI